MRKLTHERGVTESQITDAVFNACRANENRICKRVGDFFVNFNHLEKSEYVAVVYAVNGNYAGSAIVDEFDV